MSELITTDDVPATDRFAYYRSALLRHSSPTEAYCDGYTDFSARMASSDLGTLTLVRMAGRTEGRCGLRRNVDLIRRADPRGYRLLLNPQGSLTLTHNHHHVAMTPGQLALIDTSIPYDGWRAAGASQMLVMEFRQELLPLPRPAVDKLIGAPLCGRAGIGALLWTLATRAAQDIGHYGPAEAVQLSTTLLDLLSGLLAHELQTGQALPTESQRQVLFEQVQVFVQERLGDPSLSPAMIAEAHHISIRTLHRLFEPHGWTVADWIRIRRLDRCRRDLADPTLGDRPIHAIAARWGFHAASHFTRLFRARYGLSPRDYRESHSRLPPVGRW
jgi:AraC-like DNA-binding protein